jgi:hypothetical protein
VPPPEPPFVSPAERALADQAERDRLRRNAALRASDQATARADDLSAQLEQVTAERDRLLAAAAPPPPAPPAAEPEPPARPVRFYHYGRWSDMETAQRILAAVLAIVVAILLILLLVRWWPVIRSTLFGPVNPPGATQTTPGAGQNGQAPGGTAPAANQAGSGVGTAGPHHFRLAGEDMGAADINLSVVCATWYGSGSTAELNEGSNPTASYWLKCSPGSLGSGGDTQLDRYCLNYFGTHVQNPQWWDPASRQPWRTWYCP